MFSIKSIVVLSIFALLDGALAVGPSPVNLRSAANFAILAKSGVSTVPSSAITGAVGVSPSAGTTLTGFSLTMDSTNTFSTSLQVVGKLFAASYTSPTPSQLTTAISDMQTALVDANGRLLPNFLNLNSGNLAGLTLTPGLYKWTSAVSMPTDITLIGSSTDTWIFQIAGTFGVTAGKNMILAGGALAKNIVWAVSSSVTVGNGAHVEGIILSATGVTFTTGSSLNGRILAQTAVALQKATIVQPA